MRVNADVHHASARRINERIKIRLYDLGVEVRRVRQHCQLTAESNGYLEHAMEEMNFSARAHDRILKVARTLADLSGSPDIRPNDILEAIQYRSLDRKLFS